MNPVKVFLVPLLLILVPSASAHFNAQLEGYSNPLAVPSPKYYCGGGQFLPSTASCSNGLEVVNHVHARFIFPMGGMATMNINIQETTFGFDYITWYDRTCATTQPYVSQSSVSCFGGQLRDWHTSEAQKWRGEGSASACVPGLCTWRVGIDT